MILFTNGDAHPVMKHKEYGHIEHDNIDNCYKNRPQYESWCIKIRYTKKKIITCIYAKTTVFKNISTNELN